MSWIRLYRGPKLRKTAPEPMVNYYLKRSFKRYLQTEDGKYMASLGNITEVGRVENMRFIEND